MKKNREDAARLRWQLLGLACSVSLTHQVLVLVIGIRFFTLVDLALGAGVHISLFSLGAILARLALGLLPPFRSLYGQIQCGMLLAALADLIYFLPAGSGLVFLARLCHGFGFGLAGTAIPVLMTLPADRPLLKQVNGYGICLALASTAGQTFSTFLAARWGQQGVWLCMGCSLFFALFAVVLATYCRMRANRSERPADAAVPAMQRISLPAAGRCGKTLLCYAAVLCLANGCLALLPVYFLQRTDGLGMTGFALLSAAVGFIIRPLLPWLFRRVGIRGTMGASSLGYGAALCLLAGTGQGVVLAGILQGVFGACAMTAFHWLLLRDISPAERGRRHLLYLLDTDLGMILCGAIWAWCCLAMGVHAALWMNGLALCGLCAACGLLRKN